jgi:hypothetical protein
LLGRLRAVFVDLGAAFFDFFAAFFDFAVGMILNG